MTVQVVENLIALNVQEEKRKKTYPHIIDMEMLHNFGFWMC